MSSGYTEEEPRYAASFSLKSLSKRTPPGSPTGAPMEGAARLQGLFFFHTSLKLVTKIPLNEEIYPFS